MGNPVRGTERRTFVGRSEGTTEDPARLDEALASAAALIVEEGLVSGEQTAWFDMTSLEVEIGNQHIKTCSVGLSGPSG